PHVDGIRQGTMYLHASQPGGKSESDMSMQGVSMTDSDVDEILNDLVRETLDTLFPVTLALAWLWLASEIIRGDSHVYHGYVASATLLVALVISRRLGESRLRSAVGIQTLALFLLPHF